MPDQLPDASPYDATRCSKEPLCADGRLSGGGQLLKTRAGLSKQHKNSFTIPTIVCRIQPNTDAGALHDAFPFHALGTGNLSAPKRRWSGGEWVIAGPARAGTVVVTGLHASKWRIVYQTRAKAPPTNLFWDCCCRCIGPPLPLYRPQPSWDRTTDQVRPCRYHEPNQL